MLQSARGASRVYRRDAFQAGGAVLKQNPRRHQPAWRSVKAHSVVVKDDTSRVEFNLAQKFWDGEAMRCLGAATRLRTVIFVAMKVYSVAAYVEAERCAKELGIRERGGFFQEDGDFTAALLDGAFNKALLVRLVRDATGEQFVEALDESLRPRMTLAGETDKLAQFSDLFTGKKLVTGTEVVLFWNMVGELDILVTAPGDARDYERSSPELRIKSPTLCRALFELYMGSNPLIPEATKKWADGARNLLESENVKRASRKAGSG